MSANLMTNDRMVTKLSRTIAIGSILIISFACYGQSRSKRTDAIIEKMNLVEMQRLNYEFHINTLKYQATGRDSIRLVELERELSDDEIIERIRVAFTELFNDKEIAKIYGFLQTTAFEKLFNSGGVYEVIDAQFTDINTEIERITQKFRKSTDSSSKFESIPVDRKDGFYATVDHGYATEDQEIKLEQDPALTSEDILEVSKGYRHADDRPEISIVLTSQGARKFQQLTYENVGRPVAIVIDGKIVSLPIVQAEIIGGKLSISGDFSDEEIDGMLERLKGR